MKPRRITLGYVNAGNEVIAPSAAPAVRRVDASLTGPTGASRRRVELAARRRARRVAIIYGAGAAIVVGWAAYLGLSLPDRNIARHWNVAWVGLDCLIVLALAYTAWRGGHNDRRVVIPAVATATLLVVDAWMDITTAARADLWQSILLAVALEIPLAALSLLVARRALNSLANRSEQPITPAHDSTKGQSRPARAAPRGDQERPRARVGMRADTKPAKARNPYHRERSAV